ncbi:helix-turn-helix domain-containing protein [Rhodocyclus purpureus]|uniref:helix-turn-helix domain-containing protein n=1 Tax=Rhodocyclus purpureus TaxID=1067 RepID=UPI0019123A83|nr:helix-turn-helix domain-containing protein [Rhodocyclus purpureus]
MNGESVTISKDEYIDLLRCKSASMDAATVPPRKPHSWLNQAEKEEIRRLAGLGIRPGEIGQQLGRSRSTVHRWVKKLTSA